jgi:hypothetical protein
MRSTDRKLERFAPWLVFVFALMGLTYFAYSAPWVSGPGVSGGSGSGIPISDKCAANGVACLDSSGLLLPAETVPSQAHTKFTGAFTAASCTRDGEIGKSTTEGLGYCDAAAGNWVKQSLFGDAFNTWKIGGTTVSASGSTTLETVAGRGIVLTGPTGTNPVQGTINAAATGFNSLTQNSTTPSVSGFNFVLTNSSVGTNITNFTSGAAGQILYVRANDANTTLVNGATMALKGGVNAVLALNNLVTLILEGTVWREIARNF